MPPGYAPRVADDELQALRRQVDASPDDLALAREYERRLLRAGFVALVRASVEARSRCPRTWEELEDDGRPTARHCARCGRTVTRVQDLPALRRHASHGRAVAATPALLGPLVDDVLKRLRDGDAPDVLPRWHAVGRPDDPAPLGCGCLDREERPGSPRLHDELQDTDCDAWRRLLAYVDQVAADGRELFDPYASSRGAPPALPRDDLHQIVTLPPTIAKLKRVRKVVLYGSHLTRLPPEIGEMSSLTEFHPYTSYGLHWFPYELTRCRSLVRSCVSTRALYGNYKHRPPFPDLSVQMGPTPATCSVCDRPAPSYLQVWTSLRVATDVLPLLVNACSAACVAALPTPASNYAQTAHRGGLGQLQPPRDAFYAPPPGETHGP